MCTLHFQAPCTQGELSRPVGRDTGVQEGLVQRGKVQTVQEELRRPGGAHRLAGSCILFSSLTRAVQKQSSMSSRRMILSSRLRGFRVFPPSCSHTCSSQGWPKKGFLRRCWFKIIATRQKASSSKIFAVGHSQTAWSLREAGHLSPQIWGKTWIQRARGLLSPVRFLHQRLGKWAQHCSASRRPKPRPSESAPLGLPSSGDSAPQMPLQRASYKQIWSRA